MSDFKVTDTSGFEVTRNGISRALEYFAKRGCCQLFVLSDPFLVSNGLAAKSRHVTIIAFKFLSILILSVSQS